MKAGLREKNMIYWQILGWVAFGVSLVFCWSPLGWQKLKQEHDYQHFVFSSAIILFCLWAFKAGINKGLDIHLIGMTLLTLCHGPKIAIWIATLPLVLMVTFGFLPIEDAGLYAMTTAVIPAMISYSVFIISYRYLQHHLFVYFFVGGFFNGAINMVIHLCIVAFGYWITGIHSWEVIENNYLLLVLLMWFPEGMINGMGLTLLSLYRPHWLRTFYDKEYLEG